MKTPKPYSVHFVCRGNTYRSRLAAAYFAELSGRRFVVSSSGIRAAESHPRTIKPYTRTVAAAQKLKHGLNGIPEQTTERLLQDADVIVFMNKDVYDDALKEYAFDVRKAVVWNVPDIDGTSRYRRAEKRDAKLYETIAAETFPRIKRQCDELYTYLTYTAWADVVTPDNQLAGIRLPMSWVTDRGLWHRGVHVIARTSDGKFVVGKRTNNIIFAPGMLEITLGGGIDSDEQPLHAAMRETQEELGITVPEKHFRPLFMYQWHSYHPHYNKLTRTHLYVYAVTLPVHSRHMLHLQPEEVQDVQLLSERQVKHLLRTHRVTNFGRLKWGYKLYDKAVAYALQPH